MAAVRSTCLHNVRYTNCSTQNRFVNHGLEMLTTLVFRVLIKSLGYVSTPNTSNDPFLYNLVFCVDPKMVNLGYNAIIAKVVCSRDLSYSSSDNPGYRIKIATSYLVGPVRTGAAM